jgi:hypothetical protein
MTPQAPCHKATSGHAISEARLAARRDPRLYLPPILEALVQTALGRAELARGALMSARRLRPELTQQEIERSHGRRAAKILNAPPSTALRARVSVSMA